MPSDASADGLLHHGAQAALVDVAHGEGADAGIAHVRLLRRVHVAQPHDHACSRVDLRLEAEQVRPAPADPCPAMQASGMPWTLPLGLRFGRVHVGVRVQPDQADASGRAARKWLRDAADRADRHGMVAAQHERHAAARRALRPPASARRSQAAAICGRYLASRIAFGRGFGLFDGDVAQVFDLVAERGHARIQVGDAYGGGAHIDAAAALAEIERRADDGDVRAGHRFSGAGLLACPARSAPSAHGQARRPTPPSGTTSLELRVARRARERDHVADVFHAGEVHQHALEAHAEAARAARRRSGAGRGTTSRPLRSAVRAISRMRSSSTSWRSSRWLPPMISPMRGTSTSIAAHRLAVVVGAHVERLDVLADSR